MPLYSRSRVSAFVSLVATLLNPPPAWADEGRGIENGFDRLHRMPSQESMHAGAKRANHDPLDRLEL